MYAVGGAGCYTGRIVAAVLKDDVRHCGPTPTCVYAWPARRLAVRAAPRCRSLVMRENHEMTEVRLAACASSLADGARSRAVPVASLLESTQTARPPSSRKEGTGARLSKLTNRSDISTRTSQLF